MTVPRVQIESLDTPELGDRSYIVGDGSVAAVIDPQRDIDRILEFVDGSRLELTHVFETHIHNDYVSGGLELARTRDAAYVVAGDEKVSFERRPVADGDEVAVGTMRFRALHTPGHTPLHLSYVLGQGGRDRAVFTGGSMLFGTVGRTDLVSADAIDGLTRAQYRSVRRMAAELHPGVEVYPTHGFGSFCTSTPGVELRSATVADERSRNLALTVHDEDTFVERALSGLTAYPSYYAHMAPLNRAGPAPIDLSPVAEVDADELRRRLDDGEWVVDVRARVAFAASHLAGTVSIEIADQFATYLGWVLPWGTPVNLVAEHPEEVEAAQRQMARIGIDRPSGRATGGIEVFGAGGQIRTYRVTDFGSLAAEQRSDGVVILDVRRDDEWVKGHITGAVHIPLSELQQRIGEVPDGELWVHCAGGFRASIAASLLDAADKRVVLVDDDFETAGARGLEMVG